MKYLPVVLVIFIFVCNVHGTLAADKAPTLCPPTENVDSEAMTAMGMSLKKKAVSRFLFLFSDTSVKFPKFHEEKSLPLRTNQLHGFVSALDNEERQHFRDGWSGARFSDVWSGGSACAQFLLEPVKGAELISARCANDPGRSLLLNEYPENHGSINPATIVAICSTQKIEAGPYKGTESVDCTHSLVRNGFLIEYSFQEPNSALIGQFDAFLTTKIDEWKQYCN